MWSLSPLFMPDDYPSLKAVKSCSDSYHGYDPEAWELEYQIRRYLKYLSNEELKARHSEICKNLLFSSAKQKAVIPRQSISSLWYWILKEYQVRYEFFLRNEKETITGNAELLKELCRSYCDDKPLKCKNYLYRYSCKKYIHKLIHEGEIRIQPASQYACYTGDAARNDDELLKKIFVSKDYIRVTTNQGEIIPVTGNISYNYAVNNYYTLCVSSLYNDKLKEEFGGSCAIIKNIDKFIHRLLNATQSKLNNQFFFHGPVEYYDPYINKNKNMFDTAFRKDFKFTYQNEYRFIWEGDTQKSGHEPITVKLGSLADIVEQA